MLSIKVQKVIRFIPIVNLITVFCWTGLCLKTVIKPSDYAKTILKMFGCIVVTVLLRLAILSIGIPILETISLYATMYLFMLSLSWFAVQAQEKMLQQKQEEEPERFDDLNQK